MTDTPETEKDLNAWHRIGVFSEGIHDGLITAISGLGLAVDAVNHAPRLLNILPGVDNIGPIAARPFLGSTMIHESLTGAHDAYKNAVLTNGASTFDPVDLTDHLIYGGGYATGMTAGVLGTSAAANVALAARPATALSAVPGADSTGGLLAQQFVKANGDPNLLGHSARLMERGAMATGRYAATFPLRHPFATAAAVTYVDVAHNDAHLTSHYGKEGANFVSERIGIGPIFSTESNPDGFAVANLMQDPAKLAGMATVLFAVNGVLSNVLGGVLGFVASLALALTFHEFIGEKSNQLVDWGRDLLDGTNNPQEKPPQPAIPVPAP